jgi:hypothetical protein
MKRITAILIAILLSAGALVAQEKKAEDDYNTTREFKNKVFMVQNRDPNALASAVKLLGSGFKGAGISINSELRTITVRDFPENVAAIEEAVKRLDQPAGAPDIELKISVLIASKTPLAGAAVPDELAPVVKQLQSALSYSHYGLMTATVHRTKIGNGIEGSGIAEPTLLGMTAQQERPILYSYKLRGITGAASGEQPSIDINRFEFAMRVPIDAGGGSIQYQQVGFETPVSIKQREKVVIGTTTMGSKALIVVVTANIGQ